MSQNIGHLRGIIDASDRVHGVASGLRGWLRNVLVTLRRNHERRAAIRELRALSDRQLEDIGVVRAQIPQVVNTLAARKAAEDRVADKKVGTVRFGAGYCIGHG